MGSGGARVRPRRSLHLRRSGIFPAERLKKPLSSRIILAIEGRPCVLDSGRGVFPAARLKKPLSGRIILAIEGCQCVRQRINRRRGGRRDRDRRVANLIVSADRPGRGIFSASTEGSSSCAITALA